MIESEGWYCFECNGMGGWEIDGDETDYGPSEEVDCACCDAQGQHHGDEPPRCHPAYRTEQPKETRG